MTVTLINHRKIDIQSDFSFFVFTEIVKSNTRERFCNYQIVKLNTRKMHFVPNVKLSSREF